MKRVLGIGVILCAVVAAYFLFTPSNKPAAVAKNESAAANPEGTKTVSDGAKKPRHVIHADASGHAPLAPIVQTGGDFAKGEMQNVKVVNGALQLADDASYVPRFKPNYKIFGSYVSNEQPAGDYFDIVVPNFEMTPSTDSEMTFEFRTRGTDNEWSTWHELTKEPGTAMPLEQGAVAWQYRLTFFANDPAKSPQVRSVSMTAKRTEVQTEPDANFSASNAR